MRFIWVLCMGLLVSVAAMAAGQDALLNKVEIKLNAEQWVATKSALVSVGIDATVGDSGLDKIQDLVLQKLSKISDQGSWHIVTFDRSLDQSGLEKIHMSAEARLPAAALVGLRNKAKLQSKPGEVYVLENVLFTPSYEEILAANTALRSNIYQQAKEEVERLNKVFVDQKFYVHKIDFIMATPVMSVQSNAFIQMKANSAVLGSGGLTVGNKMELTAIAVLASFPEHGLIKDIT